MKVYHETLSFSTKKAVDFVDLTDKIQGVVDRSRIKNGIVNVFSPGATTIIALTEYASDLLRDIRTILEKLIPENGGYEHPYNAFSHLRSLFLGPGKTIPIVEGRVAFGTWQSCFFIETDYRPRKRTVIVQAMGEE